MLQYLKLVNGDEIVADYDATESDGVNYDIGLLHDPCRVILTNQGMVIIPYPTKCLRVEKHHVLFTGDPELGFANAYRQQVSGLQVAPATALDGLKANNHGR